MRYPVWLCGQLRDGAVHPGHWRSRHDAEIPGHQPDRHGSAGASNTITLTKSIEPGGFYTFPELIGHTLNAGDSLSILAGTASALVIRGTAREVS